LIDRQNGSAVDDHIGTGFLILRNLGLFLGWGNHSVGSSVGLLLRKHGPREAKDSEK
jgi:hypothetical protein